jgi:tRNA-(ms[2]io[6]A)-hydroxylase
MSSRLPPDGARVTLRCETDPRWLRHALAHHDQVLIDHAHCEKKAAAARVASAAYPEVPGLPAHMARLAREESGHLARVLQLLERRGLALGRDPGDPYAQGLQGLVRTPAAQRQLDRFLVAAIIEARSSERLALLAEVSDADLRRFYRELARARPVTRSSFFASPGASTARRCRPGWSSCSPRRRTSFAGCRSAPRSTEGSGAGGTSYASGGTRWTPLGGRSCGPVGSRVG